MKTEEIAIVAVVAYLLLSARKGAAVTTVAPGQRPTTAQPNPNILGSLFVGLTNMITSKPRATGVTQIGNDDVNGQPGAGWQYYSDGTSISPAGDYYSGSKMVWSPAMNEMGPVDPTAHPGYYGGQ